MQTALLGCTVLLLPHTAAHARVTTAQGVQAARQLLELAPAVPRFCGTALAIAASEARQGADPLMSGLLASALQRPALDHEAVAPPGHFRLHYDTTGRDAGEAIDDDDNGLPDYVDLTAAVADSVWELQIDILGYNAPPSDGGA